MVRRDRLTLVLAALLAAGALGTLAIGQQGPDVPVMSKPEAAMAAYKQAVAFFDQKKYAEARVQVEMALQFDPDFPDAELLKNRVDAEIAHANGAPLVGEEGRVAENQPKAVLMASPPEELLTPEQVNRLRMFEMSDSELKGARGGIAPADLADFWEQVILKDPNERAVSAQDRSRFLGTQNLAGQLARIRDHRAVNYFDKVKLTTDPADIRAFKTRIQPYVLLNCATSGCHGGANSVLFRLYGNPALPSATTDRETYTNFLVLSTVVANGHGVVDRADPASSLVLQYVLPRRDAAVVHPKVEGKEVAFRRLSGTGDGRYKEVLEWVKSLAYPQPNYDTKYKIVARRAFGGEEPATMPATMPATRPGKMP